MRRRFAILAAAVSIQLVSSPVWAASTNYTFVGANGANWNSAVWTPAGVPGLADSATVQVAGGNIGINLTTPTTVGALTLGTPSGAPFTTNIGNGSTANPLAFDNTPTGGAVAPAAITSGGVVGATNIISAPVSLSGTATLNFSITQVTAASTNSLSMSGGIILNNNTTGTTSFTTNGVFRTLQVDLLGSNTLNVGPITSQFANPAAVVGSPIADEPVVIVNRLSFSNRVDTSPVDYTRASFGTINLNGNITDGTSFYNSGTDVTYVPATRLLLGQGGTNVGNSIATFNITGSNSYSGGFQLNRANVILGSDTALGTGSFTFGDSASPLALGFNLISDNDARKVTVPFQKTGNLTIKGTHSLTFQTGTFTQGAASSLINLLPAGKTLTLAGQVSTIATSGSGALLSIDGSGKTVISGNLINSLGTDGALGRLAKNGDGLLVLSGAANTYKLYSAVNGGVLEFASSGAVGRSDSAVVNPGGAIGLDSGSTIPFTHPVLGSITLAGLINRGTIDSTGALALANADAAASISFISGTLANARSVGMSIRALPGGVNFTGSITPEPAKGYRLGGGGGTLTLVNTDALSGPSNLNVMNGGTVSIASTNNNFVGSTWIKGAYVVSLQQAAAADNAVTTIGSSPFFIPPGVYEPSTLEVSSIADGNSSIGAPINPAASNLLIQGSTLRINGTGGTSTRLFTIGSLGATLDSSGASPVEFSNTGAIVSADATGVTGTSAALSNQITAVSDVSSLAVGMSVIGTNIPANAVITGIRPMYTDVSNQPTALTYAIFISQNATGANAGLTFGKQNRTLNLIGSNAGTNVIAGVLSNSATGTLGITKSGSGTWRLSGNNTYTGTTTVKGGKLILGAAAQTPVLSGTSTTGADVQGGRLVFEYTGASPGTTINGMIAPNKAANFTTGIIRNTNGSAARALGVYDNGVTVLVASTLYADGNLDGIVNALDFNAIATNFGLSSKLWYEGDYNYSGSVDTSDFNLLAGNFNQSIAIGGDTPLASASLGALVPEPAGISLLAALGAMGLRRRRLSR